MMTKIEKMAKSLKTLINKVGCDGTDIKATEVVLTNGNPFVVEYMQLLDEGVFLSDADGGEMYPFTDIADEKTAEALYDLTLAELGIS